MSKPHNALNPFQQSRTRHPQPICIALKNTQQNRSPRLESITLKSFSVTLPSPSWSIMLKASLNCLTCIGVNIVNAPPDGSRLSWLDLFGAEEACPIPKCAILLMMSVLLWTVDRWTDRWDAWCWQLHPCVVLRHGRLPLVFQLWAKPINQWSDAAKRMTPIIYMRTTRRKRRLSQQAWQYFEITYRNSCIQ